MKQKKKTNRKKTIQTTRHSLLPFFYTYLKCCLKFFLKGARSCAPDHERCLPSSHSALIPFLLPAPPPPLLIPTPHPRPFQTLLHLPGSQRSRPPPPLPHSPSPTPRSHNPTTSPPPPSSRIPSEHHPSLRNVRRRRLLCRRGGGGSARRGEVCGGSGVGRSRLRGREASATLLWLRRVVVRRFGSRVGAGAAAAVADGGVVGSRRRDNSRSRRTGQEAVSETGRRRACRDAPW